MLESVDRDDYTIATYYVEDNLPGYEFIDHLAMIQAMALEGSTGTWEKIKDDTSEVREALSAKVVGYYEVPAPPGSKKAVVQLAFPTKTFENNINIPMIFMSFAGNCFIYPEKLKLVDVSFAKKICDNFMGPKFGIEGTRKILGVYDRPLSLHIIKPKMGMTPEQTADQCYQTALGGVDLIKDDEMTSDPFNSNYIDRIKHVMAALEKAEKQTGKKVIYFCSITDDVDKLPEKAKKAIEAGANGLLIAYSSGPSILRVLAEDPEINVPLFLHPSHMLASLDRIAFPVFTKICRLSGADFMLSPTMWSSTPATGLEESYRTAHISVAPMFNIKRTWPMPAAGMYPGLMEVLYSEYGNDQVIPAGGGMLGHPDGYTAGAMAWQQAIDAVVKGIPLIEYAKVHKELRRAIEKWGVLERPHTPWGRYSPTYLPKPIKDL